MLTRSLRRLALPLVLLGASVLGTAGVAPAAPAGPAAAPAAAPTGPVASAPIHIFRCSSQGSYMGIWVNQRLTWCVANAGRLTYRIDNVTSVNGGNNNGIINYTTRTGSGSVVFSKYKTTYVNQISIQVITIY